MSLVTCKTRHLAGMKLMSKLSTYCSRLVMLRTGSLCIGTLLDVRHKSNFIWFAHGLCAVEDVLKPPGSLLATDRSKAVVLVWFLLNVFWSRCFVS